MCLELFYCRRCVMFPTTLMAALCHYSCHVVSVIAVIPGIIVGLSVGLDTDNYGNSRL